MERLGPADLNTKRVFVQMITRSSWSVFPNPSSGAFLFNNTVIPVEVLRTDVFNSSGQRMVEVHSIANGVSLDLSTILMEYITCDVTPRLAGQLPSFKKQ